jgi:hypothetical protein
MRKIVLILLLLMFLLHGCLSQIAPVDSSSKSWIGHSIAEREAIPNPYASSIGWKEKIYRLDNGMLVYVEPVRPGCFIHWEVNPQGIIVGYKLEGNRCY